MKKTTLTTIFLLPLLACDHTQSEAFDHDGQGCIDSEQDDPPPAADGAADSDGSEDTDHSVAPPPARSPGVHDVTVSIDDSGADGEDILIEFEVGTSGTGAIHVVRGFQMTIELVQNGETLAAIDADMVQLRDSALAGVSCGTTLEDSYEVVFADTEKLDAAAIAGAPLNHTVAFGIAVADNPQLENLFSPNGAEPLNCEGNCNAAGGAAGAGVGGAASGACCIGTVGWGCLPCAAAGGAAGFALGGLLSAGCKGLFC